MPAYNGSETDIAWAAGLLDGEGCFGLNKFTRKDRNGYREIRTSIQCNMTVIEPLAELKRIFGGFLNGPYTRANPKHKPYYKWSITNRKSIEYAIRLMRPYIRVKRHDAAIVLDFIHWRKQQGYNYTPIISKWWEII